MTQQEIERLLMELCTYQATRSERSELELVSRAIMALRASTTAPGAAIPRDLLLDIITTMRHARTFICYREKMHKDGIAQWDALAKKLCAIYDGDDLTAPKSATEGAAMAALRELVDAWDYSYQPNTVHAIRRWEKALAAARSILAPPADAPTAEESAAMDRALLRSTKRVDAPTAERTEAPVRRFSCFEAEDGVYEHAQGSHVAYADYALLAATNALLTAELAEAKETIDRLNQRRDEWVEATRDEKARNIATHTKLRELDKLFQYPPTDCELESAYADGVHECRRRLRAAFPEIDEEGKG